MNKIKGLILLDVEYSKGKPFFVSSNIAMHLSKESSSVTLFSNLDNKTLQRLSVLKTSSDFKDESGKSFDIMQCSIIKNGETFHIKNKSVLLTHGELAYKKITFIYNGDKIIDLKDEKTKVFNNEPMSKMLTELKNAYSSGYEFAGTNISIADIPHLKKAIRIQYAISNDLTDSQYSGHMAFISQIEQNAKDIRASFINTILEKRVTVDNIEKKSYRNEYIDYCIKYGLITRRLNLRTNQQTMMNFMQYIVSKNNNSSAVFSVQKHNAGDDVNDLCDIIKIKIKMLNKVGSPISFSEYKTDKDESDSFSKISLRDIKNKLKQAGYLIYNGNDKMWKDVTEKDVENTVMYVPTRPYDDDPKELKDLIYMKYDLKKFKEVFKRIINTKTTTNIAELYELGMVKGINKVTIDSLIEADIGGISDKNRVERIKYILYFFLEQQKAIGIVSVINSAINDGIVQGTSYSSILNEAKTNKKLLDYIEENKKSKVLLDEGIKRYQNSLNRAILIEKLEFEASNAISRGNVIYGKNKSYTRNGGIYYERKKAVSINEEYIGNDSIIYTNGNALCLYYAFIPQNSFLYIAFQRNGVTKYKSYLYNGITYEYYVKILQQIISSGSIGSAVWKTLRGIKTAIQSRADRKEKGRVDAKSKFFERLTGEKNKDEKYDEGIRHDITFTADDENMQIQDSDAKKIAGNLYVKAFIKEASTIRRKK